MASVFALRNELRSIVLKGFQRLYDIEMLREVAEFALLEARMVVAATQDGTWGDSRAPSPEEIAAARDAINAAWDDEERERRRKGQKAQKLVIVDVRRVEQGRKYREANREKIKERKRASMAANRDQINARKREARTANAVQNEKENARRRERRRKQRVAVAC